VVQLLLSRKVLVDAKDRYDSTPLFAAARNGHEKVVEHLLAFVEFNIDSEDGPGSHFILVGGKDREYSNY
jgi:ankyrin repeat protein